MNHLSLKPKYIFVLTIMLFILTSCANSYPEPKITETEAEKIVIEAHTSEFGKINIISVKHQKGRYIIEWENLENCESGVDQIDDQNGYFIEGEHTIC